MIRGIVVWGLTSFPEPVKEVARRFLPVPLKRYLGRKVMEIPTGQVNEIVETKHGFKFTYTPQRLFMKVQHEGVYEQDLTDVLLRFIDIDDTAVDVGANFGWYSIVMASKARNGKVFSFEPTPSTYELLEKNITLNELSGIIRPTRACVGNSVDPVFFNIQDQADGALNHVELNESQYTVTTQSVILDDQLPNEIDNIAYIKIDVEGYEKQVLEGCDRIFSAQHKPVLQIELNEDSLLRAGSSDQEIIDILEAYGYKFAVPANNGLCRRVDDPINHSDLICFANGRFAERLANQLT